MSNHFNSFVLVGLIGSLLVTVTTSAEDKKLKRHQLNHVEFSPPAGFEIDDDKAAEDRTANLTSSKGISITVIELGKKEELFPYGAREFAESIRKNYTDEIVGDGGNCEPMPSPTSVKYSVGTAPKATFNCRDKEKDSVKGSVQVIEVGKGSQLVGVMDQVIADQPAENGKIAAEMIESLSGK